MSIKPLVRSLATLTLALLVAPIAASSATAVESSPQPGTNEKTTNSSILYTWAGKIYLDGKLSTKESIESLSITGGNFGTFSKVDGSYIVKLPAEAKILTFCYTSRGDAPYNTNSSHCTHLDTSLRTNKNSEIPNNYDLYFNTNSGKIITGIIVSPAKKVNGQFSTTYIKVYNELGIHESMNVFGNKYQIYIPSEATRITFCQKDMDCIEQELKYLANFTPSSGKVTYDPSFKKTTPKPSTPITNTTPKPSNPITNTTPKPSNPITNTTPKPGTQAQKAATDLSNSLNVVWKPTLSSTELIRRAVSLTPNVSGVIINSVPFYKEVTFYDVIAADGFRCVIAKLDDKKLVYSVENSDCRNYINIVGPDNLKILLKLQLYIYSPLTSVGMSKYTPELIQKFGATITDKNLVVLKTKKGIAVSLRGKADVEVLLESDSKGKLIVTNTKPGIKAQKAATDLASSLNKVWNKDISSSELISKAVKLTPYVSGVTINSFPYFEDIIMYDVIAEDGFRCVAARFADKKIIYSAVNSDCKNYVNTVGAEGLETVLYLKLFLSNIWGTLTGGKYTPEMLQKFGASIKDKNLSVTNTPRGISVSLVGKADVVVLMESDSQGKLIDTNTKSSVKAQKAATDLANSLNKVWNKDISSSELISKAVKLTPYVSGVTINSFPYFEDIIMYDVIAEDGFRCVAARFVDEKIVYSAINSDCKNYVNTVGADDLENVLYLKLFLSNIWGSLTGAKYTPEMLQKFGASIKDKNLSVTNTPRGISVSLVGKADVVVLMESDSKGKLINN